MPNKYNDDDEIVRRLRVIYANMKRRCDGKKPGKERWYSDKGIVREWASFSDFYHDMRYGYAIGLTIDRIDNNKNYCKDNCRWANWTEQARNRSNNRQITISGVTKPLIVWITESKIPSNTIKGRIYNSKWPVEKALGLNPNG